MTIDATDAKRSDGGDPPVGEGHDKKMAAAPITPAGVPPELEGNQDILAGSDIRGVMMGTQEGSKGSGASFGPSGNAFGLDPLTKTAFLSKLNETEGGEDSTEMKTFVTDYFDGDVTKAQEYARKFVAGEVKIPSPTKTNVKTALGGEDRPPGEVPLGRPDATSPTLAIMARGFQSPNDVRSPSAKTLGNTNARQNSATFLVQGAVNALPNPATGHIGPPPSKGNQGVMPIIPNNQAGVPGVTGAGQAMMAPVTMPHVEPLGTTTLVTMLSSKFGNKQWSVLLPAIVQALKKVPTAASSKDE
jgi:hypothetical protein